MNDQWQVVSPAVRGFPFLDAEFDAPCLASFVAGIRWRRDGKKRPARDYVLPDVANTQHAGCVTAGPSEALSTRRRAAVAEAIDAIVDVKPRWAPLMTWSVEYRWIPGDGVTSRTVTAFPQRIYLGDDAFASAEVLRESLVHEFSHIWYGMLEETAKLQHEGHPARYTLPSGRGGRDARSVVIAAAFAACVLAYMSALPDEDAYAAARRPYLRRYLLRSCEILATVPNLTACGTAVAARLEAFGREHAIVRTK